MRDHQIQEIAVVGAGLTGVMTALALSYSGYGSKSSPTITLIDRTDQNVAGARTATQDHRTTTINAAGMAMLSALGVWPLIAENATPIHRIKVAYAQPHHGRSNQWQRPEFSIDWHENRKPMAYVVSNESLLEALHSRLALRPAIHVRGEVIGYSLLDDYAYLRFNHGQT